MVWSAGRRLVSQSFVPRAWSQWVRFCAHGALLPTLRTPGRVCPLTRELFTRGSRGTGQAGPDRLQKVVGRGLAAVVPPSYRPPTYDHGPLWDVHHTIPHTQTRHKFEAPEFHNGTDLPADTLAFTTTHTHLAVVRLCPVTFLSDRSPILYVFRRAGGV